MVEEVKYEAGGIRRDSPTTFEFSHNKRKLHTPRCLPLFFVISTFFLSWQSLPVNRHGSRREKFGLGPHYWRSSRRVETNRYGHYYKTPVEDKGSITCLFDIYMWPFRVIARNAAGSIVAEQEDKRARR